LTQRWNFTPHRPEDADFCSRLKSENSFFKRKSENKSPMNRVIVCFARLMANFSLETSCRALSSWNHREKGERPGFFGNPSLNPFTLPKP
jgi:hypothetical protein